MVKRPRPVSNGMNKAIAILSVAALIGAFLVFYNPKPTPSAIKDNSSSSDTIQKWETKTDEQASVTVVVTPIDLSSQSTKWKFNVAMDTHSIELNEDMMESAVLMDEQGREYKPVNWDGPTGGHHLEGVLTFKRVMPSPQSIELKITGVGDVTRSFTWQL